jgi:hypothetical protein
MAIPKMPAKAWLQIAVILGLFFVALTSSHHLWSTGQRAAVAGIPLIVYTGLITLYSAYKRVYRNV